MNHTHTNPLKSPGKIPVLSLLQPWASLVVKGLKQYETRSWTTKHRGPLLIHASASVKALDRTRFTSYLGGIKDNRELPLGQIIGVVTLRECYPTDYIKGKLFEEGKHQEVIFGDYGDNRFAWRLEHPLEFKTPVPYTGGLSIWDASNPKNWKKGPTSLLELEMRINEALQPWPMESRHYAGLLADLRAAYEAARFPTRAEIDARALRSSPE